VIDLVKINTNKNPADMMTKTIQVEAFSELHQDSLKLSGEWAQKRGERKVNETEVNFYGGTQDGDC